MHDLLTRGVDASGRLRPPREEAPGLYRESAVGWVPREWEIQSCESICKEIIVGIVIDQRNTLSRLAFRPLRSANVREWGIVMRSDPRFYYGRCQTVCSSTSTVTRGGRDLFPNRIPRNLMRRYPGIRSAKRIDLVISRPGSGVIADYLALWINSDFGKQSGSTNARGTRPNNTSDVGAMKRLLVALPEQREQLTITSRLSAHDAMIRAEEQCMYKLRADQGRPHARPAHGPGAGESNGCRRQRINGCLRDG